MRSTHFILVFLCSFIGFGQTVIRQDITLNQHVDGTLLLPNSDEKNTLVIIIAGSGPTDRDGNQNFMKNNSLKKLAEGITSQGFTTFRYDKRVVKQIRKGNMQEEIKFDDFVSDGMFVVNHFIEKYNFDKIFVAGHSQGSLVGMVVARETDVDGFISLAGAGNTIDKVIVDQIKNMAPGLADEATEIFNKIRDGKLVEKYPPALASIFNKDVQSFLATWVHYNPTKIIAALDIPILIVNGTKDLQVSVDEAKLLHEANKDSQLLLIQNMNHVLVTIKGDQLENSKSYNESKRSLSPDLISKIVEFIDSK